ncbi:MAG: hypothetical protein JKY53_03685 [Flavobacteriales bacterium]|nr:hypothetical protein [Flavobacteriales bacterium]
MNIREAILQEHSKKQVLKIANYVGNDKERFAELMQIYFDGPYRVTQRGAWVLHHCAENNYNLVYPYLDKMVEILNENAHNAVKRNTLKILGMIDIPKYLMGTLTNKCFAYLKSETEPIAIRVFAMTVLYNITKTEPDLKHELKLVIEELLPYGSAGIKSRGKKTLKLLQKLK